jgi:hypothetical protein
MSQVGTAKKGLFLTFQFSSRVPRACLWLDEDCLYKLFLARLFETAKVSFASWDERAVRVWNFRMYDNVLGCQRRRRSAAA